MRGGEISIFAALTNEIMTPYPSPLLSKASKDDDDSIRFNDHNIRRNEKPSPKCEGFFREMWAISMRDRHLTLEYTNSHTTKRFSYQWPFDTIS